jgi:hypothetical protein
LGEDLDISSVYPLSTIKCAPALLSEHAIVQTTAFEFATRWVLRGEGRTYFGLRCSFNALSFVLFALARFIRLTIVERRSTDNLAS